MLCNKCRCCNLLLHACLNLHHYHCLPLMKMTVHSQFLTCRNIYLYFVYYTVYNIIYGTFISKCLFYNAWMYLCVKGRIKLLNLLNNNFFKNVIKINQLYQLYKHLYKNIIKSIHYVWQHSVTKNMDHFWLYIMSNIQIFIMSQLCIK